MELPCQKCTGRNCTCTIDSSSQQQYRINFSCGRWIAFPPKERWIEKSGSNTAGNSYCRISIGDCASKFQCIAIRKNSCNGLQGTDGIQISSENAFSSMGWNVHLDSDHSISCNWAGSWKHCEQTCTRYFTDGHFHGASQIQFQPNWWGGCSFGLRFFTHLFYFFG